MEDFDLAKAFDELLKPTDPPKGAALKGTTEAPNGATLTNRTEAPNPISLKSILPCLPPEGQAWLNSLNPFCRRAVEHDLRRVGSELFMENWESLRDTLQKLERDFGPSDNWRYETESRSSDRRHVPKEEASLSSPNLSFISTGRQFVRSVRNTIRVRGDSLKAAITTGLAHGLAFAQRMQSTAKNSFNIFRDGQWIIKYSQNGIAGGPIVAALVVVLFYWIMPENNHEAKSHSLISASELAFSDVTLTHSLGTWEVRGVIKNNSARTVRALWLKVTVRDCPNDCVTVGEAIKRIAINIPPSQTRIIDEGDLFSREMFIPEKPEWGYEIFQTDAE
jgi:hypothetical protein